eukprot:25906-Chlamydomonas_euryale.AAC.4
MEACVCYGQKGSGEAEGSRGEGSLQSVNQCGRFARWGRGGGKARAVGGGHTSSHLTHLEVGNGTLWDEWVNMRGQDPRCCCLGSMHPSRDLYQTCYGRFSPTMGGRTGGGRTGGWTDGRMDDVRLHGCQTRDDI